MRNKQVTDTACSKLISYRKKYRQKKKNKGMGGDKECPLGTGYEPILAGEADITGEKELALSTPWLWFYSPALRLSALGILTHTN